MATLNEMIAQGAQFNVPDPTAQYNKLAQMQKYQQENELAKMQMEEYGRARQESNALRQFLPGLNESNRSQLLGFGTAGQGVYKALGEGETQRRLAEQAKSQAAVNRSNEVKNAVAQTRNAVAGIDPNDSESYMALRTSVLNQYPELGPYMPNIWNGNVQQRLLVTADSVLEGQKPRPPVILSPGQMAIPANDPRLMGLGVTAPAAAAAAVKPPDKITIMTGLGYPLTPEGNEAYEAAIRAKPTVSAPTGTLAEMRATGIPETPEGLELYYRLKEKPPVVAAEARTTEEKNAELIALGAGPKGSPEFNAALRAEVLRMTAKPAAAVAAAPAPTEAMKNADSFAIMKGERGTPAYNKEYIARMEKFTAKSSGGEGGTADRAPSMTTIVDPTNPNQMLSIDARRYAGGGVGSVGVIGVSGKEPGAAVRQNKVEAGKTQLADDLENLRASFLTLDKMRAIPSTNRNPLSNIASATAATGIGQILGRATGTEAQVEREVINSARTRLVNSIKNATGMSAQQLNSNVELQTMLKSISDPGQPVQAALRIIEDIENAYVKGAEMPKKNAPGGSSAPAPTAPASNITQQRQDANAAIAKGAPAAAVRQRFKQNTGQEL